MQLDITTYILWLIAPAVQLSLLVAMYRRGLFREYPFFFNYTILQVLGEPFLLYAGYRAQHDALYYAIYYYGFWTNTALSAILSFFVLQEIFYDAFRPFEALRDLSVLLFRWCALVVLLVAAMWALTSAHTDRGQALVDAINLGDRSVRLVQCGLVFFLVLFSEYLGISRRNVLFGIAVGFGVFASINMLVVTAGSGQHVLSGRVLIWVNSGAYDFATLVWLGYMLKAPVRVPTLAYDSSRSIAVNNILLDVREPISDSVLEEMDRTVERLLYPREEAQVKIPAGS
jgi:hypothetical protein